MTDMTGHIEQMGLAEIKIQGGVANVVRSVKLAPSFGPIWYTDINFGFPEVDTVMTPFMNANGVYDETRYHRARAVSISLKVINDWFPEQHTDNWDIAWNSSWYWLRELGRWVVPYGRYRLYWRTKGTDAGSYWMDIRGDSLDAGIQMTDRDYRNVQLNFTCPSGRIYKMDESPPPGSTKDGRRVHQVPFLGAEAQGITFPLAADGSGNIMTFPGVSYGNGTPLFYDGTVETGFIAQIFSDAITSTWNPKLTLTNRTTGEVSSIGFQGLEVDPGHMVEIDTQRMTVVQKAPPYEVGESVEQYLTGPLTWPQLAPGENAFDYTLNNELGGGAPPSPGENTYVNVLYYPAYLI